MSKATTKKGLQSPTAFKRSVELPIGETDFVFTASRGEIFKMQLGMETGGGKLSDVHNFLLESVDEAQEEELLKVLTAEENMTAHQQILVAILPALTENGVKLGEAKAKVSG